ncbi:MAG: DinB family protein [Phycisphaerales bacterium]|jgi:uncharacterized damage-inducible protein DinB
MSQVDSLIFPIDTLLAADQWGTRQIIDAAAGLTHEQFTREFAIGPGSLQKTLSHMLSAMLRTADVLGGQPPREPLDATKFATPDAFVPLFDQAFAMLRDQAKARPISDIVTREFGGKTYRFTRNGTLLQITTHGFYHRAQCVNMLRQLGVTPLPDPSVMKWMMGMQ